MLTLTLTVATSQAQCALSFTWFEKTALYFLVPLGMGAGTLLILAVLFALHGCGFRFGFRGRRGHRAAATLSHLATLRLAHAVSRMSEARAAFKGGGRKPSMRPSVDSLAAGAETPFSAPPEWMNLFNMCCHAYLYLLTFTYMLLTKRALEPFDCEWR